jgi:hypothetical protein
VFRLSNPDTNLIIFLGFGKVNCLHSVFFNLPLNLLEIEA